MLEPTGAERLEHVVRRALDPFDDGSRGRRSELAMAQDEHRVRPVRPDRKRPDDVVGVAPHQETVDRRHKGLEPMLLLLAGPEEVEPPVAAGEEAVEADTDEHRGSHMLSFPN